MLGIRLVLNDKTGKHQGVARMLRYEGHMLVYDPQINGAGWLAMRDIPSSLTEVKSRSASDLGNFYPIPCTAPVGPTPPGEPQVEYTQTEAQPPKPPVGNFGKLIDWDTDDVQDWSCTPSPVANIDEPVQGAAEETPPAQQSRCLVPERVPRPEVVPPQESTSGMEEKTQKEESTPAGEEQSTPVAEDDVLVLYAGAEDL